MSHFKTFVKKIFDVKSDFKNHLVTKNDNNDNTDFDYIIRNIVDDVVDDVVCEVVGNTFDDIVNESKLSDKINSLNLQPLQVFQQNQQNTFDFTDLLDLLDFSQFEKYQDKQHKQHIQIKKTNDVDILHLCVYVLKLTCGKYYVGKTKNVNRRIGLHMIKNNIEQIKWTKIYRPVKILEQYNNCDNSMEMKILFETMKNHGIENVRGGPFNIMDLTNEQINLLRKKIKSAKKIKCNECLNQIKQKEKAKYQISKYCAVCELFSHDTIDCKVKKNKEIVCVCCYICKKPGHCSKMCIERHK